MKYDVFISHASEDKDEIARPLAILLQSRGLTVWLDEMKLTLGDSLRRSIDLGLNSSRFGLVILSPSFLSKEWPQKELDGLVARENDSTKVILPIWHKVSRDEIVKYSPILADKLAAPTSKGLGYVVDQVVNAVGRIDSSKPADNYTEQYPRGRDLGELVVDMLDRIVELADNDHPGFTGVATGFLDLDRLINGLQPGTLNILAGRPLSGKSAFALAVAQHIGTVEGLPVALFSMATTASQTLERLVCTLGRIEPTHLRTGRLEYEEWPKLTEAIERLRHASIYIFDNPTTSVQDIVSESRQRAKSWGAIGTIIIDSIQHLAENKNKKIEETCRELKQLARELNCPILATSTLPIPTERRLDPRPILEDFYQMGAVDLHTDLVLLAYRDESQKFTQSGVRFMELIVAKQRDLSGQVAVKLAINSIGSIENPAPTHSEKN